MVLQRVQEDLWPWDGHGFPPSFRGELFVHFREMNNQEAGNAVAKILV